MKLTNSSVLMNLLLRTKCDIKAIFSPEPVIFNLILISICLIGIVYMNSSMSPISGRLHSFIIHALAFSGAFQIIKSSKKSLFITVLFFLVGIIGIYFNQYLVGIFDVASSTYKDLLITSIIGIIVGVFCMA